MFAFGVGVAAGAYMATAAVNTIIAELVLQAAMTDGSTVRPAAPIRPFFSTSRLVT
jgi:hypothetical protein